MTWISHEWALAAVRARVVQPDQAMTPATGAQRLSQLNVCLRRGPLLLLLLFGANASISAQEISFSAVDVHPSTGNSSVVCGGFGQPCCCNQDGRPSAVSRIRMQDMSS